MRRSAWLGLLALACTRRDGAAESAAPPEATAVTQGIAPSVTGVARAETAPPPAPADDVTVAQRWLDALRDGKMLELEASTHYPFELHEKGGCNDQAAASREQLAGALACLSTDAALLDLLRRHEPSTLVAVPDDRNSLSDEWQAPAPPDHKLVTGFFHRADSRVDFDIWVPDGRVGGVWKLGPNGTREVGMVTEWLEALRNRDLERLARVTSYPLEVRDKGRDATCGKRVARRREELSKAVDCLFRSERLHQALVDSFLSRPEAQESSQARSSWAAPWWRDGEHRSLRSTYGFASTREGLYDHEFDLQFLAAPNGVRVFWKLGSRESNE